MVVFLFVISYNFGIFEITIDMYDEEEKYGISKKGQSIGSKNDVGGKNIANGAQCTCN